MAIKGVNSEIKNERGADELGMEMVYESLPQI